MKKTTKKTHWAGLKKNRVFSNPAQGGDEGAGGGGQKEAGGGAGERAQEEAGRGAARG